MCSVLTALIILSALAHAQERLLGIGHVAGASVTSPSFASIGREIVAAFVDRSVERTERQALDATAYGKSRPAQSRSIARAAASHPVTVLPRRYPPTRPERCYRRTYPARAQGEGTLEAATTAARPESAVKILKHSGLAQRKLDALLATLKNPRVRDVAWSIARPGLCCSSDCDIQCQDGICDIQCEETLWADASATSSLFVWEDLRTALQDLDKDPTELLDWLDQRSSSLKRTGRYYEAILHFAFEHFSQAEIVLVNEAVPRPEPEPPPAEAKIPLPRNLLRYGKVIKVLDVTYNLNGTLWVDFELQMEDEASTVSTDAVALELYNKSKEPLRLQPSELLPAFEGMRAVFQGVAPELGLQFRCCEDFSIYLGSTPRLKKQALPDDLGEIDFILRPKVELQKDHAEYLHLETAVIYFCAELGATRWDEFKAPSLKGNDPVPTLAVKLGKMLHQLERGQHQHIRTLLATRNRSKVLDANEDAAGEAAAVDPQSIRSILSTNGGLFYHLSERLGSPPHTGHTQIRAPNSELELGWWCFRRELASILPADSSQLRFALLRKPYWLAPLVGHAEIIEADHGPLLTASAFLHQLEGRPGGIECLIAVLHQESDGAFMEMSRGFMVEDDWPQVGTGSSSG